MVKNLNWLIAVLPTALSSVQKKETDDISFSSINQSQNYSSGNLNDCISKSPAQDGSTATDDSTTPEGSRR